MQLSMSNAKRFQVALSFAGENRAYIEEVARALQEMLTPSSVFYDNYYIHELARPNLDTYLLGIYRDDSELIAVFLCEKYPTKDWCGLEWRAVRDMIKTRQSADIMPFVFGDFDLQIEGLLSIDGYIRVDSREPIDVAELIVKRIELRVESKESKELVELVLDESFATYTQEQVDNVAKLVRSILGDNDVRILSKRRGSVVLTLLLRKGLVNALVNAAQSGALDSLNLLAIRQAGRALLERSGTRRSSEATVHLAHRIQSSRAGVLWGARALASNILVSLLYDLHGRERAGLSSEQCGNVKACLSKLISSRHMNSSIFHSHLVKNELETLFRTYGQWNDIAGFSDEASALRHAKLQQLRLQRSKIQRQIARRTFEAADELSRSDVEFEYFQVMSTLSAFEHLANESQGAFPILTRACQTIRIRSKA
ncbi:MAG: hypothetical protein C0423_05880 [Methylibium sp.]|nr:hypothetical protein [Methylibium sp.]